MAPNFFSQLAVAVAAIQTKRAPAAQWRATLETMPGITHEELRCSGVLHLLDAAERAGEPVSRDDILAVIKQMGIKVTEVVLGGSPTISPTARSIFSGTPRRGWRFASEHQLDNKEGEVFSSGSSLGAIFEEARRKNWCTRWGCSTCAGFQLGQALGDFGRQQAHEPPVEVPVDSGTTRVERSLRRDLMRAALRVSSAGAYALLSALRGSDTRAFPEQMEFALRLIASHVSADDIRLSLKGSEAGALFELMLAAKQSGEDLREAHRRRNDPEFVEADRAGKAAERAERHEERLSAKRLRDQQ